jgi:hypothetical protein
VHEEVRRLEERKTWQYIGHPGPAANIISSKWVYRTKHETASKVLGYRACMVACGFTQQEGVDFQANTFAPV